MSNLRGYMPGDETGILRLFNTTFHQNRSLAHWNWQFKQNPAGDSLIALGEVEGEIVAQATLIPSEMKVGSRVLKGGQSIDAMVHQDHRRRGYFENLSFLTYEMAAEAGIDFRYSFPNPTSLNGILKKLGGILVARVPVYLRVNRVDHFAGHVLKSASLAKVLSLPVHLGLKLYKGRGTGLEPGLRIEAVKTFDQRFDALWQTCRDRFPSMTQRTSEYLNWRIAKNPNIAYQTFALYGQELKGYVVVKVEEKKVRQKYPLRVGNVVDLLAVDEQAAAMLLTHGVHYLEAQQVDFTTAWMLDHTPYRSLLKGMGFIKSKDTIPFAVKDLTPDGSLEALLYPPENWYLMPIEADTY